MGQNFLLITFDQLRADWFNPYQDFLDLPNLRSIARNGRTYTRCYTSSPQCIPARLSWLTGKMPSRFGITKNIKCSIRDGIPTLFQEIRANGWYTELIGKTHWTEHNTPGDLRDHESLIQNTGFAKVNEVAGPRALRIKKCNLTDEWEEANLLEDYKKDIIRRYKGGRVKEAWESKGSVLPNKLYPDIWIAERACEAITRLPTTKPWFLWISFVGPHEPFDTPQGWKEKCMIKTPEYLGRFNWDAEVPTNCELYDIKKKWENTFTQKEADAFRMDYAANLQLLDQQIAKIMGELKRRKDKANTITMITADHGEMLGDYGMLYKSTFLEPAVNVPLVIAGNSINDKTRINRSSVVNTTNILKALIKGIGSSEDINGIINKMEKRRKGVVEYGDERCFIRKRQKITRKMNGEILWRSNISDYTIEERLVTEKEIKTNEWKEIESWSLKRNEKLNKKINDFEQYIAIN